MEGGSAPLEECGGEQPATTAPCMEAAAEELKAEELPRSRVEGGGRLCEDEARTCRIVREEGLCGQEGLGARCCRSCASQPSPSTSSTSNPLMDTKLKNDYWLRITTLT